LSLERVRAQRNYKTSLMAPRKTLKNLFQEHGVPPWDRQAPLLYIQGELVAVAGVGVSYPHLRVSEKRIWPEWSEKF